MNLRVLFMFLNEEVNVIVTCVFLVSNLNYNSCHIPLKYRCPWRKTNNDITPTNCLNYHQKQQIQNQVTVELNSKNASLTSLCWQIFAQPLYDMFETALVHLEFNPSRTLRFGIRTGYVGELDFFNWFVRLFCSWENSFLHCSFGNQICHHNSLPKTSVEGCTASVVHHELLKEALRKERFRSWPRVGTWLHRFHNVHGYVASFLLISSWFLWRICVRPNNLFCKSPYTYLFIHVVTEQSNHNNQSSFHAL